MNKLTIPAILVATVMVAGIFAFMPVQQASTVHTTIQGTQLEIRQVTAVGVDDALDASVLTITADDLPFQLLALRFIPGTTGTPVVVTDEFEFDDMSVDGATMTTVATTVNVDITAGGYDVLHELGETAEHTFIGLTGTLFEFTFETSATPPDTTETVDITITIVIETGEDDPTIDIL